MHTWRIMFTTHASNKGLTSTIYKEVLGINKKGVEKLGTRFSGKALTWHTRSLGFGPRTIKRRKKKGKYLLQQGKKTLKA